MQETKNKEIIKQSSYYKNIEVVKNFLLQKLMNFVLDTIFA